MKRCYKCKELKPRTDFYKDRASRDGLQGLCKKCCSERDVGSYTKFNRREYCADWRNKNREKLRRYQKGYMRKKRLSDPLYVLRNRFNAYVRKTLKHTICAGKWVDRFGYTLDELRIHLQANFTAGMSWDKFFKGNIHIDHIKPISSFDFSKDPDATLKKCWALPNLQPLWAMDNFKKGNK